MLETRQTTIVKDSDDLSALLARFNEEICKGEQKGRKRIVGVAIGTEGKDEGKNLILMDDTLTEPLVPMVRVLPSNLNDQKVAEKIAAIEKADKVRLRENTDWGNFLIGVAPNVVEKFVVLFDPAPEKIPQVSETDDIPPHLEQANKESNSTNTSDHWLTTAKRIPIGNGESLTPLFVVIHFTEGWEALTSIEGWQRRTDGVLAHIIVDRDGQVFQCRPFNQKCSHAGGSRWRHPADPAGKLNESVNSHSIGIEIANTGDGGDDNLHARLKKGIGIEGLKEARHRNASVQGSNAADTRKNPRTHWEIYPTAQLESVFALVKLLMVKYGLVDITGHDCILFEAKTDPGPLFPMQKLREDNDLKGLPIVWNQTGKKINV